MDLTHCTITQIAQLGKIGSNLNQLARQAHLGRHPTDSLEEASRELAELRLGGMA